MSSIKKEKVKKTKYPDKTSVNLLQNETSIGDKRLQIMLFVLFVLILLAFVKFFVVDRLTEAYQAKQAYIEMEQQIADLQDDNKNYEAVREQYSHYGNGYLNDEERAELDRIVMMKVIDNTIVSKSEIRSLNISGNVAMVTIDNVQLNIVSQIVASVESQEEVSYVTVSTAGTNSDTSGYVTATMEIYFYSGGGEA